MSYDAKLVKQTASPNLKAKYSFIQEKGKLIFLSSFDRPSILKLNIYLNSTLKPELNIQKFSQVFEVKNKVKRPYIFELKARNSIEQILKSEKLILEEFEKKLWNSKNCKDCLDIVYIKPDSNAYEVGIGSTQRHSELLEELCFLERIPNEYFVATNLNIKPEDADCETSSLPSQNSNSPLEEYTINAFFNVGLQAIVMARSFKISKRGLHFLLNT